MKVHLEAERGGRAERLDSILRGSVGVAKTAHTFRKYDLRKVRRTTGGASRVASKSRSCPTRGSAGRRARGRMGSVGKRGEMGWSHTCRGNSGSVRIII